MRQKCRAGSYTVAVVVFITGFGVSWFAEITVAVQEVLPSSVVVLAGTVVTLVLVTVYVVCVYVDVTAATAATAAVAAVAATSLFSVTVAVESASPRSSVRVPRGGPTEGIVAGSCRRDRGCPVTRHLAVRCSPNRCRSDDHSRALRINRHCPCRTTAWSGDCSGDGDQSLRQHQSGQDG